MSVGQAGAVDVEITLAGNPVPVDHQISFVVDRDIGQPDMAAIVLTNTDGSYSKIAMAAPVEIKVGTEKTSIYIGEVVGLEPTFKGGEKTRILIRAMNKFHRLLRYRKSITFTDKTDQQIISQVVGDAGLTLDWKHEKTITYKHVYQHNQSAMEFVRTRGGRMGCHIWCVDKTLNVKQPDLGLDSGITISITASAGEGAALRGFTPRVNSASIVKKVTVKGWNPETKELISGEAEAQDSPLGAQNASAASGDQGDQETFTVDQPIWSKEEADALAKARLVDSSLQYVTGEAEVVGDPKYDLAKTVTVMVNPDQPDDVFNGKYYVMGITHRFTPGGSGASGKDGGFVTMLRLARDAQKGQS